MTAEAFLFDPNSVFAAEDYLYFYRESLTDERSDAEVHALEKLLTLKTGHRLLDLACGFGRHANRFASLGYAVTGVDLVSGFLDLARNDAAARGVHVDYLQADMRSLNFDAEFDRVVILFTAFGYFEADGNVATLKNAARALKPGGLLCLDTHNRDVMVRNTQPFYVTEIEGNLMIDRSSFDTRTGRWNNRRIILRDGVRKDLPFSIQLYNPNEMIAVLAAAGLELVDFYGGFDGQPFTTESRRMVVLARRS